MKRQKGIVLNISNKKAIILTPDGQFLEQKFSGQPPLIGSEIEYTSHTNRRNLLMLGIAAVLMLTFIPLLAMQLFIYPQTPVAYVTVDINPSIEMGLNRYDNVISTKGLNQEGIELLNKVNLLNLNVEKALEIVTEEAIREKYINTDKENAVIISYSKKETKQKALAQKTPDNEAKTDLALEKGVILENKVKEVIERNKQQAIVEIVHVSHKVRKEADELGLSTGKYTLMLEAWDEGLEISLESIKGNSVINVIKETGVNPREFISQIKEKNYNAKEFEELAIKYAPKINELKNKNKRELEKLAEHIVNEGKNEREKFNKQKMSERDNSIFPEEVDKNGKEKSSDKLTYEKNTGDTSYWGNNQKEVGRDDYLKRPETENEKDKDKGLDKPWKNVLKNKYESNEKESNFEKEDQQVLEKEKKYKEESNNSNTKNSKKEKNVDDFDKAQGHDKLEDSLESNNDIEELKGEKKDNNDTTPNEIVKEDNSNGKKNKPYRKNTNKDSLEETNESNTGEQKNKPESDVQEIEDYKKTNKEEITRKSKEYDKIPESIRLKLMELFNRRNKMINNN